MSPFTVDGRLPTATQPPAGVTLRMTYLARACLLPELPSNEHYIYTAEAAIVLVYISNVLTMYQR